jgi:hypothetical protein
LPEHRDRTCRGLACQLQSECRRQAERSQASKEEEEEEKEGRAGLQEARQGIEGQELEGQVEETLLIKEAAQTP